MIPLTAARALLGRIPLWAWALTAALAWGAWQRHMVTVEKARTLKAVQELADIRAAAAQTTVTTLTKAIAGQQEAIHAAETQTAAADTARAAVTDALGRMLERNRTAGRGRPAAPAPSASQAADAGPDMCSDMLERIGQAAGRIAAEAGRYRIAGAACEASYDSAVKSAKP